jgi:tyrosyl-tRNA synthetase
MPRLSEDLTFRGLCYQVSSPRLLERLDHEQFSVYGGFDPTSSSLQVGNLLLVCTLRRFQEAGHRPIALAGGGTGLIGDPGGKSEERPLLSVEDHAANMAGIASELGRFLDFSAERGAAQALLLDNESWLGELHLLDFLREVGKHFTVNQMVAKESVRSRLDRPDQGISYAEFSYMLLQAYDFLYLYDHYGCRIQLGGSDQWGNITMGTELIRRSRRAEAYALTSPLVVRSDGTKFGKSDGTALYLDPAKTSPFALYQYFVRVDDELVSTYLRYYSFLDHEAILDLEEATKTRPERREAQRALARELCSLVHGHEEAARVERAAAALYSEEIASLDDSTLAEIFADAPSSLLARVSLDEGGLDLAASLAQSGLVSSRGAARTAIAQGGVYINNRRRDDPGATITAEDLLGGRYVVLRRGRRDYHVLCFA